MRSWIEIGLMQVLKVRRLILADLNLTKCLVVKGIMVPAYFSAFLGKKNPLFWCFLPSCCWGWLPSLDWSNFLFQGFRLEPRLILRYITRFPGSSYSLSAKHNRLRKLLLGANPGHRLWIWEAQKFIRNGKRADFTFLAANKQKKTRGGGENSRRWPQLQYRSVHKQEGFELGEGHAVDQQQNLVPSWPLGSFFLSLSCKYCSSRHISQLIWGHDLTRPPLLSMQRPFILGWSDMIAPSLSFGASQAWKKPWGTWSVGTCHEFVRHQHPFGRATAAKIPRSMGAHFHSPFPARGWMDPPAWESQVNHLNCAATTG